MSDNKKIIKISDYYKDYNLPQKCFDSNVLRNLLELSAVNHIKIFDKNKNKTKVNSKKKIIRECRKLKKLKLKELTKELNSYNISESDVSSSIIKDKNNKYINNIEGIDSIIKILKDEKSEIDILDDIISDKNNKNDFEFIETYSNN